MSFGADWTCKNCGWANLDARKLCRNCRAPADEAAQAQPPAEGLDPAGDLFARLIDESWSSLCERSDRTSPAEHHDMCLITRDELAEFIETARLTGGLTVAAAMPDGDDPAGASKAASDVLAERRRQIEAEGFDFAHDDRHNAGEMVEAALAYGTRSAVWLRMRQAGLPEERIAAEAANAGVPRTWPWDRSWWKPHPLRRTLIIAAALLIAEIERLDRKAEG